MSRALRCFVSGPLSAPDLVNRLNNINAAERAAVEVILAGHFPVVPHTMIGVHDEHTAMTGVCLPEAWWIDWCLDLLADCDALYDYTKGKPSKGSAMERTFAIKQGIPIVTTAAELGGIGIG